MPKTLVAGLFAFGLLACSGSGSKDLASKSGVASDSAAISVSAARTLAAGTTVQATIQQSVSSRSNTTGEFANRDVIVTPGTPITITLIQPLKISAN